MATMARKRKKKISNQAAPARKKSGASLAKSIKAFLMSLELHVSREIIAIIYIIIAILTVLSLQGTAGPVGQFWFTILGFTLGIWGIYLFIIVVIAFAVATLLTRTKLFNYVRMIGILLLFSSFLGAVQVLYGFENAETTLIDHGGYVGFSVGYGLWHSFDTASMYILIALFLVSIILSFNLSLAEIYYFIKALFADSDEEEVVTLPPVFTKGELRREKLPLSQAKPLRDNTDFKVVTSKITPVVARENMSVVDASRAHAPKKKNDIEIQSTIDENYKWEFPSIDLLDNAEVEEVLDDSYLRNNATKIQDKLEQFGIGVKVHDVKVGPTVMQYSVQPAEDVKLSRITALRNDLKLALAAESLRIEAPIPGKSLVGIEIPNEKRVLVRLKELLVADNFYKVRSNLRLPLGKDVSGVPLVADLASMPHLLIAGQTGAGKSMGINSIIVSLLYQNSPRDLRLILVDPKKVELKVYNNIPHLLTPVITEMDKAVNALRWLVTEMNRRYGLLEDVGARSRTEYNEKVEKDKQIPQIVCVIDELAELFMTGDKKTIEAYICRIAQLARAVGIHLIIATQRPSVDVITGLIKANIPARIAFRVTSAVDSRTILDMIGAEDLLGQGDMLYMPGNASEPTRVQGVFIPTSEVEKVINNIKLTPQEGEEVQYVEEITQPSDGLTFQGSIYGGEDSDEDSLMSEAIEVLRSSGKASTSLLQRRLKVGYSRAARMLDLLEEKGIIGPQEGSKPRKVYLDGVGGGEGMVSENEE